MPRLVKRAPQAVSCLSVSCFWFISSGLPGIPRGGGSISS